jgi:hypothetical protein
MFFPESYTIVAIWFPRLLGLIYFFAIGAFIFQIRGLIGQNGILPLSFFLSAVSSHYSRKKYLYVPTLFWMNSSNAALLGLTLVGTFLSVCLLAGIYPPLMLLLLYLIYLSIVSAGQDFLSFGWEGFLLEITAHAFLLSLTPIPNIMVWVSTNFLLFRFNFQAGAVKLQSKDKTWRDLTAIAYHYQTQPLPNTQAWYAYKLPMGFQKATVVLMFVIEMIIPFAMIGNDIMRLVVFIAFFSLQFMIWATGNFSFLNHLTVVLCVILLSNSILSPFVDSIPTPPPNPLVADIIIGLLGTGLLLLQMLRLWHVYRPSRKLATILNALGPFHLANRYGIFAVMTTKRFEIVVEGSDDGSNWKEYLFRYKPSELTRRPRRISPYQPRIDWQAWFLPFTTFQEERWFQNFLYHLLKGTPDVLTLLRENPFSDHPPKYVRALAYEYEFSNFKEKKEQGWWWRRQLVGAYSPTVALKPD